MKALQFRLPSALFVLLFVAASWLAGCDSKKDAPAQPESAPTAATEEPLGEAVDLDKLPKVEVPENGIEFNPSIPIAQLPDGAYTCDMGGLSHWSAMHKPEDGKCPVCHMDLIQVGAQDAAPAAEEAGEAAQGE